MIPCSPDPLIPLPDPIYDPKNLEPAGMRESKQRTDSELGDQGGRETGMPSPGAGPSPAENVSKSRQKPRHYVAIRHPRRSRDPWAEMMRRVRSSAAGQYWNRHKPGHKTHPVLLTEADLERQFERQGGRCYWLGIKLDPMDVFESWCPLAPGADRLRNDWGYFPSNVVITCRFANLGRGPAPVEKFIPQIRKIRQMISCEMWPKFLFDLDTKPPDMTE